MDELEAAVKKYLDTYIKEGGLVTLKEARNVILPGFVSDGKLISELFSGIRRVFLQLVDKETLQRLRPGVYLYWPNGVPRTTSTDLVALTDSRRSFDFSPVPQQFGVLAATPPYIPAAFDNVVSLSLSADFLIQRGLSDVDLEVLQGLSF